MSLALIDDLSAAIAALRQAMQDTDLSEIEKSMAHFRASLAAVQAVGAWRSDPEIKARVKTVLAELESSRMLACLMGDMAGQMHAAFASRNPNASQPLYQRTR